jgi:serine/threonine-protein kinase
VSYALSNYVAPEQTTAVTPPGPAADVHALGAMLYELLTGQAPFQGDTVAELLDQIRNRQPAPPSAWRPELPRALDRVCLKCLEKDPARRYAGADALADALKEFLLTDTRTDDFELVPGYEVLEELGRGGLGIVHKARHLKLDRLVALKVFHETLSRASLDRIQEAVLAVGRVNHPNVVHVYDRGERDGRVYIAEELVEGGTLAARVGGKPQPPAEAARLAEAVATGLHCAHLNGIVHGNLKPQVVLLTPDGVPKVSSFELARLVGRGPPGAGEAGGYAVTPAFMAPEQADGRDRDVGPATDVYGLGNVLYHLLTGRPPFQAETVAEVLVEVRSRRPAPPSRLQQGVPAELEAICLRCLEKDPGRRYASAAELAGALRRFLVKHERAGRGSLWQRLTGWLHANEG